MTNEQMSELDQKLAEAEQGALPLVRAAATTEPMRPAFPAELVRRLRASSVPVAVRRETSLLTWRLRGFSPAIAGVAVALATTLVIAGGIVYPRLTSTGAAAVLDGIQTEALATPGGITFTPNGVASTCPPPGGPIKVTGSGQTGTTGALTIAVAAGTGGTPPSAPPAAGGQVVSFAGSGPPPVGTPAGERVVSFAGPGSPPSGTDVTTDNPMEMSDRLGQALGVSGERVREAMRAAINLDGPPPSPPDLIAGLAKQLGKTPREVSDAFTNPDCPAAGAMIAVTFPVTADQVSGPAGRLGVTSDRLASAIHTVLPPPPPAPPSEDALIRRMAGNLGVSEAQLRAAITKVEGTDRAFFFSVPLPSIGKPSG